MKILITGGAGYIGSITNAYLRENGFDTVIFDNLKNGHREAVQDTHLIVGDLKNGNDVARAFKYTTYDAVIHFAALALAGESMQKPYEYYENNILGGLTLLEAMKKYGCRTIVFSSTCAVYGFPKTLPVTEDAPIQPVSVYGSSKRMFEEILEWYSKTCGISSVCLRYFNAAGAMFDGSLGEHHEPETHIIPVALETQSQGKAFQLFGDDYNTPDGTCIRDYIHVLDLASAHKLAVEYASTNSGFYVFNLGIGKGFSNSEVLQEVEKVTGQKLRVQVVDRRPGDPDAIYADSSKAQKVLKWKPVYSDLSTIVKSAWKWHINHPKGFV